jgi:hypothetical protein
LMLLYERTGYLIVCSRVGGTHAHHLYQTLRFCHFGCGFAALGLCGASSNFFISTIMH